MPVGTKPSRPCDHCDDGLLWSDKNTGEVTCDTCHISFTPSPSTPRAVKQRWRRERRLSRPDHKEYDSGTTRLVGGYQRAYYSWRTGPEYAIDEYGEIDDGLYVPHERNWQRNAAAD